MEIRCECGDDLDAIRSVTIAAFKGADHGSRTEAAIVDALRASGALTVSLVAVDEGEIVGNVAFSLVTIDGEDHGWFGLGPVSVRPDWQRRGIGQALIREGLGRLRRLGANGCVVLGDTAYYGRFGFESDPGVRLPGVPGKHFQRVRFSGDVRQGVVSYHPAFYTSRR